MLRWETLFEPQNLLICIDPVTDTEELYNLSHDPEQGILVLTGEHDITTWFQVSREEEKLVIQFAVRKKTKGLPKKLAPEWYYRDHVVVMLDMDHSHSYKYLIGLTRDGETSVSNTLSIPGELPSDGSSNKEGPSEPEHEVTVSETEQGWGGKILIPLHKGVPVIGMLVKSGGAGETWHSPESQPPSVVRWPEDVSPTMGEVPLAFGNVYVEESPFVVDTIDLGKPVWGENKLRIEAGSSWETAKVTVELPEESSAEYVSDTDPSHVLFYLPFRAKWSPELKRIMKLHIELFTSEKKCIWRSSYPMQYDAGILVREKFGGEPAERPQESDPCFLEKYRQFLLTRLPDLERQTTRDNAPSDFYVTDEEKGVHFNLMNPDILHEIASWIRGEFDLWRDGFSGASLLLQSQALMYRSGSASGFTSQMSSESILRIRGCLCGIYAQVLGKLYTYLGPEYGLNVKVLRLGARGHVVTAIETPDGLNMFDSMIGGFFYIADNTRFATVEELQSDREISYRMSFDHVANGHELYYGNELITFQVFDETPLDFPGAGFAGSNQ